ncbi:MAG: hypothetical protein ACTHLE_04270 [Agriterribacter sp.]
MGAKKEGMETVTSLSGGRTSAFMQDQFPADHIVFALVRIESYECRFKDEKVRQLVEDRIQAPFIATAEDDKIIYTILGLEQRWGRKIEWVTGPTFDKVVADLGGWLPNKLHRYCTQNMKVIPIYEWWSKNFSEPVEMRIGYRSEPKEIKRANRMLSRINSNGILEQKAIVGKLSDGRNKWGMVPWQKPSFPLIENNIRKDTIVKHWWEEPIEFADYNNCVGCFHRNPVFLRFMFDKHPQKMQWFADQEGGDNGYWRSDVPYNKIKNMLPNMRLEHSDFSPCDSGFCGM